MPSRAELSITGIVQGVGFRPFCYRLATQNNLKGFVRNTGDAGVQVILEGDKNSIKSFINSLKPEQPPMAQINKIETQWQTPTQNFNEFKVIESEKERSALSSIIPPDIALCEDCLEEMLDPEDRRYHYPFITCVNCGPRFTIIEDLPYDRPRTSMKEFPLCEDCSQEYHDPSDRRHHAEPTCCPVCGPQMKLYDSSGKIVEVSDPLSKTIELLDKGKIVAVKGIGGIHVATKTTSNEVLERLRELFNRPQQPLAVMSKDISTVRGFAEVSEKEEELLTSPQRPIMVLKHSDNYFLSDLVAPGLDSVGVMLPYSGIHHLILQQGEDPAYVMTSANLPGLPMTISNQEALENFTNLVDYFLLHDRKIVNRCDDSVIRLTDDKPTFLRRSRGYVPLPLETGIESDVKIIALGGELDVTASLLKDGRCFPTQYVGDVDKVEALEYLRDAISNLMKLLNFENPNAIACDLHPDYVTTAEAKSMAKEFDTKLVQIQHHYAHLEALRTEHELEELVGIAADGMGYGEDGTIWGGEVITASSEGFTRVGRLSEQLMPGGDLATRFPARMVAGVLWGSMTPGEIKKVLKEFCLEGFRQEKEIDTTLQQLERDLNVFRTSSCGRILDSISCLLGICNERTYEGEPAIKLESVANTGNPEKVEITADFKKAGGIRVIDTTSILLQTLEARKNNASKKDIAAAAQQAIAQGLVSMAVDAAEERGINTIGVSGGVFYNSAITRAVREVATDRGFDFVTHENLPPGDGCLSVGQALAAINRLEKPVRRD